MSVSKWMLAVAVAAGCGGTSKKPVAAGDQPSERPGEVATASATDTGPTEPPASHEPVTVAAAAPTVGEATAVVETVESDGTMTAAGREVKLARKGELRRREEVVAVDGARASKLKVTYETVTDHRTVGAQEQDVESPFAGKTFVIGMTGTKVTVAGEDGKAIKGKLKDVLTDEYRDDVSAPWRGGAAFADKTFKVGEAVTVPAKDLIAILPEGRDDLKGDTIALTYVESRAGVATFSFTGTLTRPEGKMTMTLVAKGTIKLDVAKNRPVEVQLEAEEKGAGGATFIGALKSGKTFAAP